MTNVQQPEMRRNEKNPLVQESKGPRPGHRHAHGGTGERGRPVPGGQLSPYGPPTVPRADDASRPDRD